MLSFIDFNYDFCFSILTLLKLCYVIQTYVINYEFVFNSRYPPKKKHLFGSIAADLDFIQNT